MTRRAAKRRWLETGRWWARPWLDRFATKGDGSWEDKHRWHDIANPYPFGFNGYFRYGACPCERCSARKAP